VVCLALETTKISFTNKSMQNKFEESSLQFGDRSFLILSKNANIKTSRTIILSIPLGHETWSIAVR